MRFTVKLKKHCTGSVFNFVCVWPMLSILTYQQEFRNIKSIKIVECIRSILGNILRDSEAR